MFTPVLDYIICVKIHLSKRIPFTLDRHICDLPQKPLKLISTPQVIKLCIMRIEIKCTSNLLSNIETNFQVFTRFGLQSLPMKLYF